VPEDGTFVVTAVRIPNPTLKTVDCVVYIGIFKEGGPETQGKE
jgi:hypothetical protein